MHRRKHQGATTSVLVCEGGMISMDVSLGNADGVSKGGVPWGRELQDFVESQDSVL